MLSYKKIKNIILVPTLFKKKNHFKNVDCIQNY